MRRKILLALSMVAILTVLFAFSVSAVEPVESWDISASTEDSVIAYLCVDEANEGMYTLTISGNGDMKNWNSGDAPWYSLYSKKISFVTIENGVTNIGEYAFSHCESLTSVVIPNSVTSIGDYALSACTELTIYAEAESQPSGWSVNWNYSNCPVVWDYKNKMQKDIITFKGYSLGPNGEISFGFDINCRAKTVYEELIGKTFEIGILFTGYDNLGGREPLDENGEAITLSKGKVLKINITDLGYQYYDFKMLNIGDEIKNVKLVIAGYLFDGEAVKYVQENGLSDTVTGISYNEIYCECEGHEYYMGSDGVEGVHYVTTVAPTCQMEGERCYICTRCGEANCKTEILPKTEHNYIDGKCEYCNSGSSGNKGEFEDEEI